MEITSVLRNKKHINSEVVLFERQTGS